jgi:N-methylhydantoinase A
MAQTMGSVRLGVDIGGTFTDITVLEESTSQVTIAKVPSRRGDPGAALIDAVNAGLEASNLDPNRVSLLVHGTTIVTNAVLENKLPATALLTTEGFRDILEIGRHFRPDMYDLQQDKPEAIVSRERRLTVAERVAANGQVLKAPQRAEFARLIASLRQHNVEAVAICFLNSYVNSDNEETVRNWLREELPDLAVSASCDVCREMREFERMSTVALNAAAMPLVGRYLSQITPRVRKVLPNARILIMQSSGGSLTVAAAKEFPARIITSGPAGGALAVQRMGKATGYRNLLGVDMGGTSTDISLIENGGVQMTTEATFAGRPIKLPMIEINTIGAGAGSIAWLDEANGLHVGPHSAGAEPGPVAYGKGGTEPTVTDANLVLGRLLPERFAGGRIALDLEASKRSIVEKIAKPLGMSLEEAAVGIIRIANSNMERALRVSSAEKGYDPRKITLVAFGGAGPMHAAALARAVGIPMVLIPEQPGVFSAVGLVMADVRHDFVQTRIARAGDIALDHLGPLFGELEALGRAALAQDGIPAAQHRLERTADLRYVGQAYEVNVAIPDGPLTTESIAEMLSRFHALHQRLYAHNHPERPLEFVSGRLTAIGLMSAPAIRRQDMNGARVAPNGSCRVYFEGPRDYVDTAIYDRSTLTPGSKFSGPAIVQQLDTTTLVHPGQTATVDAHANILISIGAGSHAG